MGVTRRIRFARVDGGVAREAVGSDASPSADTVGRAASTPMLKCEVTSTSANTEVAPTRAVEKAEAARKAWRSSR